MRSSNNGGGSSRSLKLCGSWPMLRATPDSSWVVILLSDKTQITRRTERKGYFDVKRQGEAKFRVIDYRGGQGYASDSRACFDILSTSFRATCQRLKPTTTFFLTLAGPPSFLLDAAYGSGRLPVSHFKPYTPHGNATHVIHRRIRHQNTALGRDSFGFTMLVAGQIFNP